MLGSQYKTARRAVVTCGCDCRFLQESKPPGIWEGCIISTGLHAVLTTHALEV